MDRNQAGGAIAAPQDFDAVFREHFAPVYRFIARRVGTALAEDLAAEVFATAYRRRTAYQPERAWRSASPTRDRRRHRSIPTTTDHTGRRGM